MCVFVCVCVHLRSATGHIRLCALQLLETNHGKQLREKLRLHVEALRRQGQLVPFEELKEFCRTQIAAYKLPRQVVNCDSIKRSPAGKADYPWAKAFALDALGLQ